MAFWTYILRCADGRYYRGYTDDLERRIGEHQTSGYCGFTARHRPVDLFRSQDFGILEDALSAELVVKKWPRAKEEALARGDWPPPSLFARPPAERVSTSAQRAQVYPELAEGHDTNGDVGTMLPNPSLGREGFHS